MTIKAIEEGDIVTYLADDGHKFKGKVIGIVHGPTGTQMVLLDNCTNRVLIADILKVESHDWETVQDSGGLIDQCRACGEERA